METIIRVEGLGKRFLQHGEQRARTFRQFVEGGWRRRNPARDFWALRQLDFTVERGEMLGIVGQNGAGKSTLLRLLGGVMRADEGRVLTTAPVHGLLDLNAGMHPDLSGRENAIIGGIMAGLTRKEVVARLPEIVAFAELEEFIDEPVRTYSSGMRLRLGFAVAVHIEPQILLIDEVLSVGDIGFQKKCLDRIDSFKARGCAIVLISHDLEQVQTMCNRVLWLSHGRIETLDSPAAVVPRYQSKMLEMSALLTPTAAEEAEAANPLLKLRVNRFGSLESEILKVELLGPNDVPISEIANGESLTIELTVRAAIPLSDMHLAVGLSNERGVDCLDVNTDEDFAMLPAANGITRVRLHLNRLDLVSGLYFVSVGIYVKSWEFALDRHVNVYPLTVTGPHREGLLDPPRSWGVRDATESVGGSSRVAQH